MDLGFDFCVSPLDYHPPLMWDLMFSNRPSIIDDNSNHQNDKGILSPTRMTRLLPHVDGPPLFLEHSPDPQTGGELIIDRIQQMFRLFDHSYGEVETVEMFQISN